MPEVSRVPICISALRIIIFYIYLSISFRGTRIAARSARGDAATWAFVCSILGLLSSRVFVLSLSIAVANQRQPRVRHGLIIVPRLDDLRRVLVRARPPAPTLAVGNRARRGKEAPARYSARAERGKVKRDLLYI